MQLKVLIAEDDKHTRTIMEHIFQKDPAFKDMEIELLLAPDGEMALDLFKRNRVDLVISDLLMPKMDGFAFCRAVRESDHGKDIPIVITSAIYKETALLNRLREELGVVFFPKPFQVREFTHEILGLLKPGDALETTAARRTRITMSGPFQGTLDVRPLPTLLLDIYDIEGTGVLLLEQGKMQKEIFFLFGRPMGAESNIRHEMLGNYLVTKSVITEKRHQELLAQAKNTRVSFLKALLDSKEFDQELVMKYHASLVKVRIVNAFRWHSGNYTFSPGDTFSERLPKSPVDPVALVFAGLKRGADLDEITQKVQNDLFSNLKFNERYNTLREEFVRVFGDTVLVQLAQTGTNIADALAKGLDPMTVYTQIYALLETGMCYFVKDPNAQAAASSMRMPVVDDPLSISNIRKVLYQPESPDGEISVVADMPMPSSAPADDGLILDIPMEVDDNVNEDKKRRMREFYMDIREKDYFQLLGLSPQASNQEIAAKIDQLARAFSMAQFADVDLGSDHAKLEEILEYLKIAHQTLSDPARKAAYIQKNQADRQKGESILDAEVLVKQAEEHLDHGRPREAIQLLEKARRIQPDVPDFHALYALALHRAHEPEEAISAAIYHALEIGPDCATVNLCAGSIAEGQARLDDAIRFFEKTLEVDPENTRAFDELDRILRGRGDFRIVERLHRKLLHQFGNRRPQRTLQLARSLANLYEDSLNDLDKARAAWEIVHAIAPHDPDAAAAMERLARMRQRLSPEALSERLEGFRKDIMVPETRTNACMAGFKITRDSAPDMAYLFAAALETLGIELPDARAYYAQFTPPFLARVWRPVDAEIWELAQDPEDFPFVGKIFETLGMHIPEGRFFPHTPEITKIFPPAEVPPLWDRALTYLAAQCSIPQPQLVMNNDTSDASLIYLDTAPALYCSGTALASHDIRQIAALAAPFCTCFWTGRALPFLATPPQLLLLLKVVIGFVSQKPAGGDPESQRLQQLLLDAPDLRAALTQTISEVSSKMGNLNVSNWIKAVYRSSLNVALLLTQNLPELYRRAPEDLRPGLLAWALSDRHAQARRLLGVSIDV
ncbi:MAG: hypothetical protein CVU65_16215 [Deltaproteobacteria bacterium HGW-Deltaproteobacteria-22]|nr:MAG: hypothetical protein CVU65_16215 [Deltaproteobacteria bacterium HGW-Deltaproteobacteria-22]